MISPQDVGTRLEVLETPNYRLRQAWYAKGRPASHHIAELLGQKGITVSSASVRLYMNLTKRIKLDQANTVHLAVVDAIGRHNSQFDAAYVWNGPTILPPDAKRDGRNTELIIKMIDTIADREESPEVVRFATESLLNLIGISADEYRSITAH